MDIQKGVAISVVKAVLRMLMAPGRGQTQDGRGPIKTAVQGRP